MRVSLTLLVVTGAISGSATLLPVGAADFFDQGIADPIDPIDLIAPSTPPASEPVKATLSPSDVEDVQNVLPPTAVVPPPKIKVVPEVVRVITGEASWYGPGFFGNRTASGEVYKPGTMTAAHRTLPFGTKVRVTNLWNGRSEVIRINDRGPFVHHRVIDLGHGAANSLGLTASGIAQVRLEVLR